MKLTKTSIVLSLLLFSSTNLLSENLEKTSKMNLEVNKNIDKTLSNIKKKENYIPQIMTEINHNYKNKKDISKELYIEYFELKNYKNIEEVQQVFHNYIPVDRSRIINTNRVDIIYSNIGEKVITNENYASVNKNIGKPLFINGLYFGTIKSIKLNDDNLVEYSLINDNNLKLIFQKDGTDKYWNKDFDITTSYIKSLKYEKQKYKWKKILNGYYPIEGSRFITTKKQVILEETPTLVVTNEVILPQEIDRRKGKPLFINGIYKGIILVIMNYSGNKTMYIVRKANSTNEIYEKTPSFNSQIEEYIPKNIVSKIENYEDYKNLQIKNVKKIHFNALSSILGFIPEIGSRFISTNFTNINNVNMIDNRKFVITNEQYNNDLKNNIDKPLFINGLYQGVIEKAYSVKNGELIYRLKEMDSGKNVLYDKSKNKKMKEENYFLNNLEDIYLN